MDLTEETIRQIIREEIAAERRAQRDAIAIDIERSMSRMTERLPSIFRNAQTRNL